MDSLAARVRRTIRRHDMLPPGSRVLVAASGGSDSTALLHLLVELSRSCGFEIAGVAHVHHGLRGSSADEDVAFCAELAAAHTLPFHLERADVAARARKDRRSLEDAARAERYEALTRAADTLGASLIAVGHTRDDQAETVLLKLLRGAGTGGLAGIHPRRGAVVRPLLEVGRQELRDWLHARDLRFVEDATNADTAHRRNAIRHCVMPVLRRHFGEAVSTALARHAEVAREDDAVLAATAAALSALCVHSSPTGLRVDWPTLRQAPEAVRRRVLRAAVLDVGAREPGLEHVLDVIGVAEGHSVAVDVPGGPRVSRDGSQLVLSSGPVRSRESGRPFCYELTVPGSIWIPEAGATVDAAREEASGVAVKARLQGGGGSAAVVSADRLTPPLVVRSWKPGDALRPLGLGGRKKVQDLFVDRKVPAAARHRVPLAVDGDGRIVWVMGHAIDEAYRVTEGTQAVVVLTMRKSGGRG